MHLRDARVPHEQGAVKSESETGKHRAHKGELSKELIHSGMQVRLARLDAMKGCRAGAKRAHAVVQYEKRNNPS